MVLHTEKNMSDTRRSSARHGREQSTPRPRKKTFLRQLIAAVICFLIIKYISASSMSFSETFTEKIKTAVTYDANTSVITTAFQNFINTNKK